MGLLEEGENLKLKDNDFVVPCVNSGVLLKTMPFLFTDGFKLYIHITLFMVCLFGCLLKWYNSGKSEFMLPSMIYGYQREEHITKSNYQGFDVTKRCI